MKFNLSFEAKSSQDAARLSALIDLYTEAGLGDIELCDESLLMGIDLLISALYTYLSVEYPEMRKIEQDSCILFINRYLLMLRKLKSGLRDDAPQGGKD